MKEFLLFLLFSAFLSDAFASENYVQERFDVTEKGGCIKSRLNVDQRGVYVFGLSFYVNNDGSDSMGKLIKLLDSPGGKGLDGRQDGLIDVSISVSSASKGVDFFYRNETADLPVYSWGRDFRNKRIVYLGLERAEYDVLLCNVNAASAFKGRVVYFYIRKAYLGK